MTQVRIEHLTKIYAGSGVPAVNEISLDIPSGHFVSLLGPSGCGKTTTLKMLAGFEAVTSGRIEFNGQDIVPMPAEKRDIGMVFQNYALFPHMTVRGNLSFGLEMRRIQTSERERRIDAVLDMVQLTPFAERYPSQISGGQQQRVAIGRALVIEPRILLLDEPLANLDAKLRDEMRVFIRDLQKRVGITTIYVTHDQSEAMTMSDLVVVMFGGRVAQAGTPEDIYKRPTGREVAGFVGQVNFVPGTVSSGDTAIAETALGPAWLPAPGRPGEAVTLALRPEAIDLVGADEAPDGRGVPATVVTSTFSGAIVDYTLGFPAGGTLDVRTIPRTVFTPGQAVRVSAAPDRFWPIADWNGAVA